MGLEAYNALPMRRAVVAVYECCPSVPLAADLARSRPFRTRDALFRRADALLLDLAEPAVDAVLQAYPLAHHWGDRSSEIDTAVMQYVDRFGLGFVMYTADCRPQDILAALTARLRNEEIAERRVVRGELAKINRMRLARMLGPEGGYDNW